MAGQGECEQRARIRMMTDRAFRECVAWAEQDPCPVRHDPRRVCRDRDCTDALTESATAHPPGCHRRANRGTSYRRSEWRRFQGACADRSGAVGAFPWSRSRASGSPTDLAGYSGVKPGFPTSPAGPLTPSPPARSPGTRPPSNSRRPRVRRRHAAPPAVSWHSPPAPSRRTESGLFRPGCQTAAQARRG
jgi:hypothetical protein